MLSWTKCSAWLQNYPLTNLTSLTSLTNWSKPFVEAGTPGQPPLYRCCPLLTRCLRKIAIYLYLWGEPPHFGFSPRVSRNDIGIWGVLHLSFWPLTCTSSTEGVVYTSGILVIWKRLWSSACTGSDQQICINFISNICLQSRITRSACIVETESARGSRHPSVYQLSTYLYIPPHPSNLGIGSRNLTSIFGSSFWFIKSHPIKNHFLFR